MTHSLGRETLTDHEVAIDGIACPRCQIGQLRWTDDGTVRCAMCRRVAQPPLSLARLQAVESERPS